ncbi:uncharacterized protein LOC143349469 [Colletes latitarsis]|uniref:uncharacterized protein LOC143349469 n=1 Tax=Colletes latitarsis TaxID=2605962 RepID=UPI004035C222
MTFGNICKNAAFLLFLSCLASRSQIIAAEVDVPELELLASNLKPEECVRLVSLDSQSPLSDAEIQKLAKEQSCFRRLVKWICQLKTVTKNTYPIVNDFLERIGRRDLIACLSEFSMKSSKSPKVIRDVQSADDSEDEEGGVTTSTETIRSKDVPASTQNSNQTIDKLSGSTSIRVSLQTAGIVMITTILLTCCCTLFIRYRIANLFHSIFRRNKKKKKKTSKLKGKYVTIDTDDPEDVSRGYVVRKSRAKRKRAPSYELIDTGTQNTITVVPKEPEEAPPTGCYKCYKKKRKVKGAKSPHR